METIERAEEIFSQMTYNDLTNIKDSFKTNANFNQNVYDFYCFALSHIESIIEDVSKVSSYKKDQLKQMKLGILEELLDKNISKIKMS